MGVLHNLATLADTVLQLLAGLGAVSLSVLLAARPSRRTFAPLIVFLAVCGAASVARFSTFHRHDFTIYVLAEPAKLAAASWLFATLTQSIFAYYPAIGAFFRSAIKYLLPVCAGLGAISFLLEPSIPPGRDPTLQLVIAAVRAAITGLLTFLVCLSLFAVWFPVRMSAASRSIVIGFLAILASGWSAQLAANSWGEVTPFGNILSSLVLLGTSLAWLFTLPRGLETAEPGPLPNWDPDRLARMSGQLDALQAQLSRRGY